MDNHLGKILPMCSTGYKPYENKKVAKRTIRRMRGRGSDVRRAYFCEKCGFWHLTKMRASQALRDKAAGIVPPEPPIESQVNGRYGPRPRIDRAQEMAE